MITHRYIHPTVELCRTCAGHGKIVKHKNWDVLHQHGEAAECPTCEGSGRVVVSKKIEVTVIPFKNKT